jgi:LysR family glycine cleavage system transcriptional activator
MVVDLESVRCFEAAATHLSFRVAAKAVALSPAAFGERIKRLEDQLAAVLFARTTRRVALTAAGHRLLVQARQVLAEAAKCEHVVREDAAPVPYELTLGTRFELGLSWLTPALRLLQAQRPERTLHLVFGDSADLIARARNGLLDAVITSSRLSMGGLAYEVLHEEDYVFVGSAALLARTGLHRSADAATHTLLDVAPDLPLFRYFLEARRGHEATWTFRKVEYLGTIGAIRLRALQSAGVAVLPRYFVEADLRARRLVRLVPRTQLQRDAFRLVWRANHPHELALRSLAAELARIPLA